jgi:hypothetical protein
MSSTLEPEKWYWGYENNNFVWFFDTHGAAQDHATKEGMFDEICGKDNMMAFEENLFFAASESELEDYNPYLIVTKEVEDGVTRS